MPHAGPRQAAVQPGPDRLLALQECRHPQRGGSARRSTDQRHSIDAHRPTHRGQEGKEGQDEDGAQEALQGDRQRRDGHALAQWIGAQPLASAPCLPAAPASTMHWGGALAKHCSCCTASKLLVPCRRVSRCTSSTGHHVRGWLGPLCSKQHSAAAPCTSPRSPGPAKRDECVALGVGSFQAATASAGSHSVVVQRCCALYHEL